MLLDNVIASAIAVGCAVSVGVLSIVIAYILHWMARIFPWMVQTVFLFFFPHKLIEVFGETWYPRWEKWTWEIVKLTPGSIRAFEEGDINKWINDVEFRKGKIQKFLKELTDEQFIYDDPEMQHIVDDITGWSKAFLIAQIRYCDEQINLALGKRSEDVLEQYKNETKDYRHEVREAERAFCGHKRSLKLQGYNNRMAALAILVSVVAIIVSIGSCFRLPS